MLWKIPLQFPLSSLCSEACAPSSSQPFFSHNGFLLFEREGKESQWSSQQFFFSYTCAKCVPASHWASWLGRCRQNFPRHRGKSCGQWGTKPAMVTSGSSLEHSNILMSALGHSVLQPASVPALQPSSCSNLHLKNPVCHLTIFDLMHINFIPYTICIELLPTYVS